MKKTICLVGIVLLVLSCGKIHENVFTKSWTLANQRVWVGPEFWSNRLQDWKVQNGRVECIANNSKLLMRTTHLINYRLIDNHGDFSASIDLGALQSNLNTNAKGGLLIGAGPELDVLGASLVQQNPGPGAGIFVGISESGELFIKDMVTDTVLKTQQYGVTENNTLLVEIRNKNGNPELNVSCGNSIINITELGSDRYVGNIAMVSDPGSGEKPGTFWFNDLEVSGSNLMETEQTAGPIMGSQYTLSKDILKLTAQMVPLGKSDSQIVKLEVNQDGTWKKIAETNIIIPGYTATFRITDWDSTKEVPYRIKYEYEPIRNTQEVSYWKGTFRHDPVEKEEIVIAGFTGNHNNAHPGLSQTEGTFNFDLKGIWYPHEDLVQKIKIHNPDILFFSGDQVYEGNSPTYPDTNNYELDYLYKWYLYCLAYRDLTKDIPTISIPDDHDVYQGNLWGQNGRHTDKDDHGGYVHPAWFVKMVERTQCSNLPDPYDPTPIDQGIEVYYTDLNYGEIGFAILEDRKFKSGCADNPFITKGRPDLVVDSNFVPLKVDLPGKKLMGDRQLKFLADWGINWKGHDMKIALSQTIFANMANYLGPNLFWVDADLDSNGWPQTGRNKAVDALRKCFAFHLAGDQHLASIVHHGVDDWDDGMYSFCVPSVVNFYPRVWWPNSDGKNRAEGAPKNMGQHKDAFDNFVTVYGVTNPTAFTKKSSGHEPKELHDKVPGYGIVRMNKRTRDITMECWPRYADPSKDEQYEGWPKTISQFDNYGRKAYGYLPLIKVKGTDNPVVEIQDEKTSEIVYSVRIKGNEFKPKIFELSRYTVVVRDTEKNIKKTFNNIKPVQGSQEELLVIF